MGTYNYTTVTHITHDPHKYIIIAQLIQSLPRPEFFHCFQGANETYTVVALPHGGKAGGGIEEDYLVWLRHIQYIMKQQGGWQWCRSTFGEDEPSLEVRQ